MIKPIVTDTIFLSQKSAPATLADRFVAQDLLDTLTAHKGNCVGMAANMIGVQKRIIAVDLGFMTVVMYNPVIVQKKKPYKTQEGCLSLKGVRETTRYQEIVVEYQDSNFKKTRQQFTGWTAQIIQHEIDHCNGVVI